MAKDSKIPLNFKETVLTSEPVFHGHYLHVQRDTVQTPNGIKTYREYILHPGAALIVPLLANGNVLMLEQYRHSMKQVYLEFPAGKKDGNEDSKVCAIRELEEEVGLQAKKLTLMTTIHPVIGYANEYIDLFLAEDLTEVGAHPDQDEILNPVEISVKELMEKVWRGEIPDVKTQIAAFWLCKIKNL